LDRVGFGGDRVEVRGLRVDGVHGVLEEERAGPQPFEVDLDLYLDTGEAAATDDLTTTADYAGAVDAAVAVVTGRPHRLLESLAGAIADVVLEDPRVVEVTVAIRKLRPPVPHQLTSAGVRIHRRGGDRRLPGASAEHGPGEKQ
jgi:7,8-dihydroneopterin aldolase/epimerase/oxygenase